MNAAFRELHVAGENDVYRILTEEKNVEAIKATLLAYGLDFTLFKGTGTWQQKEEASLAVEIDRVPREVVEAVAKAIKALNEQEAVLIQKFMVESRLV